MPTLPFSNSMGLASNLIDIITCLAGSVYRDAYRRYGGPRIHIELKAQGRGVSRGRIERLMRHHGIRAIMARPRPHDLPIAPNLIERKASNRI